MTNKLLFWIFIILGTAFEVLGDVFFKRWVLENRQSFIISGFIIYSIGTLFWAFSLRYELLTKAISILTILNLIIVVLIGVFIFKENISITAKLGILLGLISIALIEMG